MKPPRKQPNTIPIREAAALIEAAGGRPVHIIEPGQYDAAVIAAAEHLADTRAKPIVRIWYAGDQIAEVYDTGHGALWASVYELITTRDIHPVDEHWVSMIVGDRHRWDRRGADGMPRTLRASIDLLEWPDPPYSPRLWATGPSGGFHEFVLEDVMQQVTLARSNRRRLRWNVDRAPRSTVSRPPD